MPPHSKGDSEDAEGSLPVEVVVSDEEVEVLVEVEVEVVVAGTRI